MIYKLGEHKVKINGMTFLLPRVQVLLERCVWRTTQAFGLEQFLEAIMNGLRLANIHTFKYVRFCTLIPDSLVL